MLKKTEILDLYEKTFGKKLAGPNKDKILQNLVGNHLINPRVFFKYFSQLKAAPADMVSRKGLNMYAKYIDQIANVSDDCDSIFDAKLKDSVKFIVSFMRHHGLKSFDEYMSFRPENSVLGSPYYFLYHYKSYSIIKQFIICYPSIKPLILDCDKSWLYSDYATLLKNFKADRSKFYSGGEYEKIEKAILTINKFV